MPSDALDTMITRSLRRHLMRALGAAVFLAIGIGGVAAYVEISGAVVGAGSIIVQGRSKLVQHNEGGVIEKIHVHEGDKVTAGDILFVLEGTAVRASLEIIEAQLHQLLAQEARLLSELSGKDEIVFPGSDLSSADAHRIEILKAGQVELFAARRNGILGRKDQLRAQIDQLEEKLVALRAQISSIDENVKLLDEQRADAAVLHEKGLVVDSHMISMQRERATLQGSRAALEAEIIEARTAMGEKDLALTQIDKEFREAILTELDQKRVEIAKLRQERVAARDRLTRLVVRAPMTGYVHTLNVHTIGRVAAPGETLMQIVPAGDKLVIEAKLRPTDVDQVTAQQSARIRLTGLDRRTTPELKVIVLDVAPDLTENPQTGEAYYTARLRIPESEIARLEARELRPGMPVEVFIETRHRTILSYLVKPMRDQIEHAMRED
ncbi:HlyD family type I secretion periplasmic adaptor subunit [Rhodobacterales bacterium]|nr:HlyD family type I secretion periplasmic adaptor subunit [Rhodobacterales bacterium]